MKVKPNLFLNMSPQTTEDGALAFARNMKLDDDGNLVSDYGYKNISAMANYNIVGHIVGLDNKIYFCCYNNGVSSIVEYDELTEVATPISTQWTYSGGEIDGYVSTNQSGEKILTIGEYTENENRIPLKHINLSFANEEQSLYTQAPKAPTANLVLKDTYVKTIPNGVYVFFIRYKIRKDVYTNWYICSRPIFGGTSEKITTLQGGLSYIDLHKDSAKSFVFQLDFASNTNKSVYNEFQLGFIINHDEATDARAWKHFDTSDFVSGRDLYDDENLIYFDYEDVEEINIDDILETTYELYNVRNITSFKNKLYISNYIESDLNPLDINSLKNDVHLSVAHTVGDEINYKNMKLYFTYLKYNYTKGYYDKTENNENISNYINNSFKYNVSKLTKTSSKEKQDVVKFDLYWSGANDPDIAIVYNIYNYLYNKEVFGPDFVNGIAFDSTSLAALGITEAYHGNNAWVYQRSATPHPWDSRGFTFMFGSVEENEYGRGYARNGCSYFNKDSYGLWSVGGVAGWITRDVNFTTAAIAAMENKLKEEVKASSFIAKAYIEITSGADIYNIGYQERMDSDNYVGYGNDLVIIPSSYFSVETISADLKALIQSIADEAIHNNIVGIDDSGAVVLNIDGKDVKVNSMAIKFKKFDFDATVEDIESDSNKFIKRFSVNLTTTDYTSLCTFTFKNGVISVSDTIGGIIQASTLMPLSTYQPYIHFVDEHNIVSNGVKLDQFTTDAAESPSDILYLKYRVDYVPNDIKYKTFFISLVNVGDIVMEGFNYTKDPNDNNTNILHCLEIDTLLYNINDNIKIVGYNINTGTTTILTDTAKYYSSASTYPPLAFGNCGYVSWQSALNYINYRLYIVVSRNKSSENINNIVKASSYIPFTETNLTTLPDGYYGSWLCLVKKPNFELSSSCYVSGNDVYSANRTTALSLNEFNSYIQVQNSVTYFIRSNFNLNYLSLTEDLNDKIFNIGSASSGIKQVVKVINSSILSFIYELKPMYKDFLNKYFRPYDTNHKTKFDNTVRVSNVLSDETFNNAVFKFTTKDYYNIPNDRGIIVNLFAIGNNIFVHCKSSLYKFDGNVTIASNNNDIKLQESEPFETGISQIFDSEYGYGGIDTKKSGCITFDSYFFYDKSSNHIFAYSGNNQVNVIDGNIYKFLTYYKPKECKTLHDELNCRVLFEFTTSKTNYNAQGVTYNTFTLSYNYKTKTFVSFHDLSLVNAFAGRHRAYSYKSNFIRLFETETNIDTTSLVNNMTVNRIFGGATTACIVEFGSSIYKKQTSPFGLAIVLFPQNGIRETVDSIKYIADVKQNYTETQANPIYDVIVNLQTTKTNPVINFYVITDSCVSSVVNSNVDDEERPNSLLDYKGFKYDMGFWTSNYFRNNINKTNIYEYPQTYPNRALDADNNSLVYGRYFIFVFDFKVNTPIKFEEIFMNTNKY